MITQKNKTIDLAVIETDYGFLVHLPSTEDYPQRSAHRFARDRLGVMRLMTTTLVGNSPNFGGAVSAQQMFYMKNKRLNGWVGYTTPSSKDPWFRMNSLDIYNPGSLEYRAFDALQEASLAKKQ
ncbi:MAG: hypothetical protein AABX33_04840 [Nanoarchaeota archaeon]